MPEWDSEVEITADLVRSLLEEQHAPFSLDGLRLLAEGWDNAVWSVDEGYVVRVPRRSIAVAGVRREIELLPRLASLVPLPVPVPVFVGRPTERFPWPFFAARRIEGVEPAARPGHDRGALAAGLGRFLRALHDPATVAAMGDELPLDPMGRGDMAARIPRTAERLHQLAALGLWHPSAHASSGIEHLFSAARVLAPARSRALVHGDLHVRHVLVRDDGGAAGIIDWGDVCQGDPAIDLSLYWSGWGSAGRSAFVDAYGPIDEDALVRARVLALFLNAALAAYAHDTGDSALLRETLAGLARTLDESPAAA